MYRSFDPFRQELLSEIPAVRSFPVHRSLEGFRNWKELPVTDRAILLSRLATLLSDKLRFLAEWISREMGKPVLESENEIRKCVTAIQYFAAEAPAWMKERIIPSEARSSYVVPEPIGPVLAIMPWNFPFWQVIRFAVPAMIAGNVVVLKHAPNVPRCAALLEELFQEAGFPDGAFLNGYLSNEGTADLIADPVIAGVTFTGSDKTGALIASLAGVSLKKVTMELGGNDPMIIFPDVSVSESVACAVTSRGINTGQACNGAKRFLVHDSIANDFIEQLKIAIASLKAGDPMDPRTTVGPLARKDLLEKVEQQVRDTVFKGAQLYQPFATVDLPGWFFPPTILSDVKPGMTAFEEEIFGPVWSVSTFRHEEEALRLANDSRYGLGASLWTNDESRINRFVSRLDTGNLFINDFVRSDPRFPFGGVKRSGFGRELGHEGVYEFVNWKTVYRKR